MQLLCIGHKAPAFSPHAPFHFITPHAIEGYPSIVIPDDYLGEVYNGRILSEYTQLFVLADKVEMERSSEPLYLFQYRKFLAAREPQHRSTNFTYAFSCKPDEAESIFPTLEELRALAEVTLVGPMMHIGLFNQYFLNHNPRDIICFAVSLAGLVDFDSKRIDKFVTCPVLIPSPALGVYHPEMFVRHMRILKRAWQSYHENYYVERHGFQRRVGGFLLERLHSFLVYEEMAKPNRGTILTGHQVIVSDSLQIGNTV